MKIPNLKAFTHHGTLYASKLALRRQASSLGFDDLEQLPAAASSRRQDVQELFTGIGAQFLFDELGEARL